MSEIHGSGERRPEEEQGGRLEYQARMGERLEAMYAEMAEQPSEGQPEGGALGSQEIPQWKPPQPGEDPKEAYERIVTDPPGSEGERIHNWYREHVLPHVEPYPELTEEQKARISTEEYELTTQPEAVLERVRNDLWVPRDDGIARPTRIVLFDADGRRPEVVESGWDQRSEVIADWISQNTEWEPNASPIEKHAESKVVMEMVRRNLPDHVQGVVNNVPCNAVDDVVSCIAFARESLHPHQTLRLFDMWGRMHRFENNQYIPPSL